MRTLVIAHVYYPELWLELSDCIRNIDDPKSVIVTYVDESSVIAARRDFPEASFLLCENRGYDIGPFLKALQSVDLSKYELVVKLHTKRDITCAWWKVVGYARLNGSAWRDYLLAFVKTPEAWRKTVSRFVNPTVGMVADRHMILTREDAKKDMYVESFDLAVHELNERMQIPANREGRFVGGTMFAVRASLLQPFVTEFFASESFDLSVGHEVETRAHVIERMFGLAIGGQGLRVEGFDGSFRWWRLRQAFARFVWDNRLTERRRSIRICGINFYHKRLKEVLT